MTRHVASTEQGRLQGLDGSLRGIADLIGPGLFTLTFAHFIAPGRAWELPGAPFLLAAALQVAALGIAIWGAPKWPPTPPSLVTPRGTRGAPRFRVEYMGPEIAPPNPNARGAPAKP
jgi:hypothetical protein